MTGLRAITVRQPWAWAIAVGAKTVENRSALTSWRGRTAIHAGLTDSLRGWDDPRVTELRQQHRPHLLPAGHPLSPNTLGAIIAAAELVDAHLDADCCRPWGESTYPQSPTGRAVRQVTHYVFEDVRPLPEPIPWRGALGVWTLPGDLLTGEDGRHGA